MEKAELQRTSKFEARERERDLAVRMMDGESRDSLIEWMKAEWGIERAMAFRYLRGAEQFAGESITPTEQAMYIGRALHQWERNIRALDREEKWTESAKIREMMVKFLGLHAADRMYIKTESVAGPQALAEELQKIAGTEGEKRVIVDQGMRSLMSRGSEDTEEGE